MPDYTVPPAPRHLNATGKRFWAEFCSDWELADTDDLELLRLACEALDTATKARKALRVAGSLTYTDRFGAPHPRPEIAIERQARTQAAALVKQIQQARQAAERQDRIERERQAKCCWS